jgi:hypothetical protein
MATMAASSIAAKRGSNLSGNLQTGFVVVYRTAKLPIRPGFVTFLSRAETFVKEVTPMCAFLSHAIPN